MELWIFVFILFLLHSVVYTEFWALPLFSGKDKQPSNTTNKLFQFHIKQAVDEQHLEENKFCIKH